MKTLKLVSLSLIFTLFFACSDEDSGNENDDMVSERVNELTINSATYPTPNAHLFVYTDEEEVTITISNNDTDSWYSYVGEIALFEFEILKTNLSGAYTFANRDDLNFDEDIHYPFALAALTTMQNGRINDTNEEGTGIIDTWYDTDDMNINDTNNIRVESLGDNVFEIEYTLTLDGNEISGYYKGELIEILE